ncbi:MAG: hypothetical protein F4Y10_03065 [Synechococcus sp. SB0663_bin_10]|nr:hypothetical protein [Synechococcus sp. SB0663_bin_10]MYG47246.1 hypothetical protein [Synechococcus sp. SB0675_bin_6]
MPLPWKGDPLNRDANGRQPANNPVQGRGPTHSGPPRRGNLGGINPNGVSRRWRDPSSSSSVIALFGVGVVAFQSLKDHITALQDDIRAVEIRLGEDLKDLRAELKVDNRALNHKLDRVLESLRP